jgi:hypothetical protein
MAALGADASYTISAKIGAAGHPQMAPVVALRGLALAGIPGDLGERV